MTTPKLTKSIIRNSNGVFFDLYWDETHNSIHLIESTNRRNKEMYDFEQTRGIKVE